MLAAIMKLVLPLGLASLVLASCVAAPRPREPSSRGETLYRERCGRCHDLVPPHAYSSELWQGVIDRMQPEAGLSDDEAKSIVRWLRKAGE